MGKENLINWKDMRKEIFSQNELEKLDFEAKQRIALREMKELREKYGYTQHTLSIKSGIPRSTISKMETGKRNVSIEKLVQIADALGRDLEIRFVSRKR